MHPSTIAAAPTRPAQSPVDHWYSRQTAFCRFLHRLRRRCRGRVPEPRRPSLSPFTPAHRRRAPSTSPAEKPRLPVSTNAWEPASSRCRVRVRAAKRLRKRAHPRRRRDCCSGCKNAVLPPVQLIGVVGRVRNMVALMVIARNAGLMQFHGISLVHAWLGQKLTPPRVSNSRRRFAPKQHHRGGL